MDDYEIDYDEICPHCNHSPIHWRECSNYCCEDGWIDLYEYDDPLWYDPGDVQRCPECHGTGIEKWCPKCGKDPREKPKASQPTQA
jgi:hypothetical protein